jgi:hypothetical protein
MNQATPPMAHWFPPTQLCPLITFNAGAVERHFSNINTVLYSSHLRLL